MTQRSIHTGKSPTVIVRSGMDAQIEGWDDERVFASTESSWGLTLERGSGSGLGRFRARAAIGGRVLFDVNNHLLKRKTGPETDDAIQAQSGGDVIVRVPYGSAVKVYAGGRVTVRDVRGEVAVYAGGNVEVRDVPDVRDLSAGGGLDLNCAAFDAEAASLHAGGDLRFYAHDLDDATIFVDDLGGPWQAVIGDGRRRVELTAGGDVVLVTDRPVRAGTPDGAMGQVEAPPHRGS
jgi:hypothetical protein